MPYYVQEIIDTLVPYGWAEADFKNHTTKMPLWRYDRHGKQIMGIIPIQSTAANFFDGSNGGRRFILSCPAAGPAMKEKRFDCTKPQWKRKVSQWITEATFRIGEEARRLEAVNHRSKLISQRQLETSTQLVTPHGVTLDQFQTLFALEFRWDVGEEIPREFLQVTLKDRLGHSLPVQFDRQTFYRQTFAEQLAAACKLIRTMIEIKLIAS